MYWNTVAFCKLSNWLDPWVSQSEFECLDSQWSIDTSKSNTCELHHFMAVSLPSRKGYVKVKYNFETFHLHDESFTSVCLCWISVYSFRAQIRHALQYPCYETFSLYRFVVTLACRGLVICQAIEKRKWR